MAAADYRLLTEATGQRIAAALEALSGTGAAAAAARTNLDVYSKGETDDAIEQSMANLDSVTLKLTGSQDAPIKIYETETDDYKAINVYDSNNTLRYALIFRQGHLRFMSYDGSGNVIVNNQQII